MVSSRLALALALAMPAFGAGFGLQRVALGHRDPPNRRRTQASDVATAPLFQGYGTHFAYVFVGTPPQRVSVIVDTGSHITAFPCKQCSKCGTHTDPYFDDGKSSTYELMSCSNKSGCLSGASCQGGRCKLHQSYAEGSSWSAVQATDIFWVGGEHADDAGAADLAVRFPFGCQSSETGLFITQLADGIMGMDMSDATLIATLEREKKISGYSFSLCFRLGGGIMTLGGTDAEAHQNTMQYTPMRTTGMWYTVRLESLDVGDAPVDVDRSVFDAGKGMIVDSGTTDTYLPKGAASAFKSAWQEATGRTYSNDAFSMAQDDMLQLPTLSFHFQGDVTVTMPPTSYLEAQSDGSYISRVYLDEKVGGVLGANFMREHDVHFDRPNHQVGFARATCSSEGLPFDAAQDCVLSEDWYPVSACEAPCDENPEDAALPGRQNFTKIVTSPARAGGEPCPDPRPTKEDECVRDCTAEAVAPPTLPPSSQEAGSCGPVPGWTACSADCTQMRDQDVASPSGGCVPESRPCHTGACVNARGYQIDLVLLVTNAPFFLWDRELLSDLGDHIASVLDLPEGDAAVLDVNAVEECASMSLVQVTARILVISLGVADAVAGDTALRAGTDEEAFEIIEHIGELIRSNDIVGKSLTTTLQEVPRLERISSARVLVDKVSAMGGAKMPHEGGGSGGSWGGAMLAVTILAVLLAVGVIVFALVHRQKLRFQMRQQGRKMLARIRPHLDRHTYDKLSTKHEGNGFVFEEDIDFEDATITADELELARR